MHLAGDPVPMTRANALSAHLTDPNFCARLEPAAGLALRGVGRLGDIDHRAATANRSH
ncbi:hypothetical protein BX266_7051 [Streptomyces sp. TLI_171]|nr:hypothetical protein BX266_7051 [Streptomyces sp. TLI_171]